MKFITVLLLAFVSMSAFGQSKEFYLKVSDPSNDVRSLELLPLFESVKCPFKLPQMQQTYHLKLSEPVTLAELKTFLPGNLDYDYVEEVPEYKLFYTPNDLSPQQYHLTLINAEQAWDFTANASSVKIAIVDDAVELSHSDLAGNIWVNPGEIPGNGIDDDGNGYIDDVSGWDAADYDGNPNPPNPTFNHGTHVAGIASAHTDNNNGIASIGANAQIIPVKIANDATGSLTGGALGIDYAIGIGADVINMSWGGGFYSQTYQDLFDIAYAEGVVCVAAAGNSNVSAPMYPASYNHVISVGATDQNDQKAFFSNYGPTLDVSAPGVDIYSTLTSNTYGNLSGTSMASPMVAGLIALMIAANPLATVDELENCLESTAAPLNGPLSGSMGAGRIDANAAMACITTPTAQFTSDFTQVCPGGAIQFFNYSSGPGITFNWSFPGGTPATSTAQNPIVTYPTAGVYDVTLTVTSGGNSLTTTATNYVTVAQPDAVISGYSTIPAGGFGSVIVNFTGNAPYDLTLFDGTTSYPVSGITNSPYVHYFNPGVNTTYTITSFNDSQCPGTYSGTAQIDIIPAGGGNCDTTNVTMFKYLGTNLDDVCTSVESLGEYGYLILGRKTVGPTAYRNYIALLDPCGNLQWEKLYNPTLAGIAVSGHLDGNELIIVGYNGIGTSADTYMMRLDLNGNVLSSGIIANNFNYPRRSIRSQDGTILIGSVSGISGGFGNNDNIIVKAQPNGTILWTSRFGNTYNEFLHNLHEDANGNILVTGYLRDYSPGLRSGYMTKLDPSGNLLWSKRYDMGSNFTHFGASTHHGNAYYATGRTNQGSYGGEDGLILKLDTDGNILWSKRLGGTLEDHINGIVVINDTLYLHAHVASGAPNSELTIIRMDTLGNYIDHASFGTSGDDKGINIGRALQSLGNGGFAGVGYGDGGYLGGTDILFFKYNHFDDICLPSTVTVQVSDIAIQENNQAFNHNFMNLSFTSFSHVPEDVISNQGFICSNITYIDSCDLVADFTWTIPNCYTDSVNFVDQSTSSSGSVNLHIWDFGDGTAPVFGDWSTIQHAFPGAGTYNVQLIALDSLTGCGDTISYPITINANPGIVYPDTIMGCIGDTLSIIPVSSCLSNPTVSWHPDSIVVVDNGLSIVVEVHGPQYIYVTIQDGGLTIVDSIFIQEDPNCCTSIPLAHVLSGNACINSNIELENISTPNGPNPTYNWSFLPDGNPGSFAGATPPLISFPTTGPKQVVLQLTDDCGTSYDTLNLYIFEPPTFNIGQDDTICSSQVISLGENPVDNWQYVWSPGHLVSDSTIANPDATITSNTTISVIVTDPWTGCSFEDTIHFLYDSTFVNILLNDTSICALGNITIPVNYHSFSDLVWNPSGIVSTNYGDSVVVSIGQSQMVTATALGQYGACNTTDSVFIDYIQTPDAIIWDTLVCEEEGFTYIPTGDWYYNGNQVTVVAPSQTGTYTYEQQHACGIIQHEITIDFQTCSCNMWVPNSFTPNGSQFNEYFFPVTDCTLLDYKLEIYNRWGEIIFETTDINDYWDGTYQNRPVQDGSYTWKIEYREVIMDIEHELHGHVTVIR